jgi:hypothetical protein
MPPPQGTAHAPRRYTYDVKRSKSPAHRLTRSACLAALTAALVTTGCSSQARATGTISGQLLGYGGPRALEPNGSIAARSPFPVEGTITVHGPGGYSVTMEASGGFSLVVPEGTYTVTADQGVVGCGTSPPVRVRAGATEGPVTLECPVP